MKFNELSLRTEILRSIDEVGYTEASPIQEMAIPVILEKKDVVGCAQTGTGKTAAFAIPIIQMLSNKKTTRPRKIKTLILTPTRELAVQINENFQRYGKYLRLKTAVIFGGVAQGPQVNKLRNGVDIVIATPGRFNDLYNQGHIKLDSLEIFVLDEADRMLDMGFVTDVEKIIALIPKERQTLLFSATMPKEIKDFADTILKEPVSIEVTPVSTPAEMVSQLIYKVDGINKAKLLKVILKDEELKQVLVFTKTKHGADKVVKELINTNMTSVAIHGNKSQAARQKALNDFKNGDVRVLVATDIAARGIDISELPMVINFDLPSVPETYVHRIGRTGRAGFSGKSISFCNFEELSYLKEIQKLIGRILPVEEENPFPMTIMESTKKPQRTSSYKKSENQNRPRRNNSKAETPRSDKQKVEKQKFEKRKTETAKTENAKLGKEAVKTEKPQQPKGTNKPFKTDKPKQTKGTNKPVKTDKPKQNKGTNKPVKSDKKKTPAKPKRDNKSNSPIIDYPNSNRKNKDEKKSLSKNAKSYDKKQKSKKIYRSK